MTDILVHNMNNISTQKLLSWPCRERVSLKSKDIITTPKHFQMRTIRIVQLSPVLFGK